MRCAEIKVQTIRESGQEYRVKSPDTVLEFWQSEIVKSSWYDAEKEMMIVLLVSSKNHVKGYNLVTIGIVDASLCHPREVFRPAIIAAAASIILVHNHPSGDATPSNEDIVITKQVKSAGDIIGIRLLDHVIIGNNKQSSMRESGLVDFNK